MSTFEFAENPTDALLGAFRRHASGVAVITTSDSAGNPVGFTATSMTSLGANPPLAMFSVARGASSWEAIASATHVAIHTLGVKNLELAQRMAADHTKRFTQGDWTVGPEGLPIFEAATAVMIGRVRDVLNIEANAVVIVEIIDGRLGDEDAALVYHRRGYATPTERLG